MRVLSPTTLKKGERRSQSDHPSSAVLFCFQLKILCIIRNHALGGCSEPCHINYEMFQELISNLQQKKIIIMVRTMTAKIY